MDVKSVVQFAVKKNEHEFTFTAPTGCTWSSAIDAAIDVLQEIRTLSVQAAEREKAAQQPQEAVTPEIVNN